MKGNLNTDLDLTQQMDVYAADDENKEEEISMAKKMEQEQRAKYRE